jgi:hypothetical protein
MQPAILVSQPKLAQIINTKKSIEAYRNESPDVFKKVEPLFGKNMDV